MSRFLASLLAASLALFTACGGGGGGSSTPPAPSAAALDADANATPPPDPAYFKVPSTPLGAIVSGGNVTFHYWNPNAGSVTVNLYNTWNDSLSTPAGTVAMTRGTGGVWNSATVALPTQNFYVYQVGSSYVLDPYAKSMAQWVRANGATISGDSIGKGAIVDPAATQPDSAWVNAGTSYYFDGSKLKGTDGSTAAPYNYASNRDAIVYEAGIRDLTVDPNLGTAFANGTTWGTYKGLVAMLPHIQKLGVTHVQLLCPLENYTYDQTKIRARELDGTKTSGANYNWGYDPQNYFTPSGMYSANPTSPAARINELKTLVNEIHRQGMGVILDVVYNHTANNSVLGDGGIQGYYYRSTSNSGAGSNDVNSQAKMVRKLIVDSIAHWVGEYKVDGFRFDLMGVLDTQTVKAAYGAATALNPNVVFLGEGWNGYYSGPGSDYNGTATAGADQGNSAQFNGQNIAMFSDSYRNIFKNGYPNDGAAAFLSGAAQNPANLFANIAGLPTNTNPAFAPGSTNNVVSYLTCHDNLCLYDVLAMATNVTGTAGDTEILKRARVGYAVLLTSQGLAFIHAGDEMFRTKETTGAFANTKASTSSHRYFVDNSYNASDAINLVKWSNVYAGDPIAGGFSNYATTSNGYQLYAYTQGLIALRKSTDAFRLPDAVRAANITALNPTGIGSSTLAFGYKCVATNNTVYYVFHNADSLAKSFNAGADLSSAALLADGTQAGLTPIPLLGNAVTINTSGGLSTVTLPALTSAIIKK